MRRSYTRFIFGIGVKLFTAEQGQLIFDRCHIVLRSRRGGDNELTAKMCGHRHHQMLCQTDGVENRSHLLTFTRNLLEHMSEFFQRRPFSFGDAPIARLQMYTHIWPYGRADLCPLILLTIN